MSREFYTSHGQLFKCYYFRRFRLYYFHYCFGRTSPRPIYFVSYIKFLIAPSLNLSPCYRTSLFVSTVLTAVLFASSSSPACRRPQKVSPDQGDLEVAPLQEQGCVGAGRAVAVGQRKEAGRYCEILCCVPGFEEIKNLITITVPPDSG